METTVKEGKYMYCIIGAGKPITFESQGVGGRGDNIQTISFNDIAAVVSDSPIKRYPLSRDNVIPHQSAIEEVMKSSTVLPIRFATIADNDEKVRKILEKEHDRFVELLKDMEGKKELALKAILKEELVYEDILIKHKKIAALKNKIASLPPEKSHSQRMEIGRMVESALQNEKELYKEDILNNLAPLAVDQKLNSTYGEMMIINAAFLVEDKNGDEFDRRVKELGDKYGDKMKYKYVGPLPPFNFIDLVIDTRNC